MHYSRAGEIELNLRDALFPRLHGDPGTPMTTFDGVGVNTLKFNDDPSLLQGHCTAASPVEPMED